MELRVFHWYLCVCVSFGVLMGGVIVSWVSMVREKGLNWATRAFVVHAEYVVVHSLYDRAVRLVWYVMKK